MKYKPLKFKTTGEINVPKRLIDQIIGQESAVRIIKKVAKQRRHVLLIGEPGTGKSMLGQALAELLPKEKLIDILSFPNIQDENIPLIRVVPKGKGNEIVTKSKIQSLGSLRVQNIIFFILVIFAIITPWLVRKEYGDILAAASLISSMIFLAAIAIFFNLGKRIRQNEKTPVPKLLIDNSKEEKAPFIDACLLPGQKVFTNPYPMRIEETQGKIVYNAEGKRQKVVNVDRIPWKGKIYYIKPRLLFPFTATQNHPFLVLERPQIKQFKLREFKRINKNIRDYIKWKRAEELTNNDLLIYPEINHPKKYKKIYVRDIQSKIPKKITIDKEIAEIFGWYLAEGYNRINPKARKHYIGFTLGFKELEYIKRLKKLIKKRFNLNSSIDYHNKHSIELLIYSKTLTLLFNDLFNSGSKNKIIPKLVFESPKEVKLAFLNAYIKGDGTENRNGISIATKSKNIAEDIVFLFSSLGIFPACHYRKTKDSKIGKRRVKGSNIYEFNITGKQLYRLSRKKGKFQHYFSKGKFHFIPIRKIKSKEYKGDIINMETEDGTYLMPCITHNTGAHTGALLGDVLHDPLQSGGLGTPAYERLVPGIIHRANGGVLFIDEIATLRPHSQQELLTAMQEKKYSITGQSERSSGAMVRSEPVPCDFILLAAGNLETLKRMHPALRSRIRGSGYEIYMNDTIQDTTGNRDKIAIFVAQEIIKDKKIPHFTFEATQEIIQEAKRMSPRAGKLTLHLRELGGLIRAAGDLALEQNSKYVELTHVRAAKSLARTLEQQIADRYIESKKEYEVIMTYGDRIGRVNGLAVIGSSPSFSGIVLPIESEVTLGGKKAEFIATGKLGEIAKEAIKNVSAIILKLFGEDIKEKYNIYIQFLQTQEGVEGDSASIAVATAIISALKNIPIRQDTAMTGSLSVRGEVLAIGGATAKIEAAINAGFKKVIIPKANEKDITLSKDKLKQIEIVSVKTIYEVLQEALVWKGKQVVLKKILLSK